LKNTSNKLRRDGDQKKAIPPSDCGDGPTATPVRYFYEARRGSDLNADPCGAAFVAKQGGGGPDGLPADYLAHRVITFAQTDRARRNMIPGRHIGVCDG
jgi:hypothetical protein